MYFFQVWLHYHFFKWDVAEAPIFVFSTGRCAAIFSQAISIWLISWNLMLSNHFHHITLILEYYRNLMGTNHPFQESIVARNKQRTRKMYFFQVCLHYHFLNGMLHKQLFLYFPHSGVLLFLVRPSLYDLSADIWCFLTILKMYHWYWNITENWEVQTFPLKNQ